MSFFEDKINAHISSLHKTSHPEFIPHVFALSPKVSTFKIWEKLGREILTPFAPKHKIYDFEKFLPEININQKGSSLKLPSIKSNESPLYDSNCNFPENFLVETPLAVNSPKLSKNMFRVSHREGKLCIKKNSKILRKTIKMPNLNCHENLILRKSHSINIEQPIELFEESPDKKALLAKSKIEKLRNFAFSKKKSNSHLLIQQRPHEFAHQQMREVFRKKSCKCRHCGTSGKLERVTTIKEKVRTEKKEKTVKSPISPFRANSKQTNNPNLQPLQKHNSLKTDEKDPSFKDNIFLQGKMHARMSVNVQLFNSERLFMKSNANADLTKNYANGLKAFIQNLNKSRKNSEIITKKKFLANKNYFHSAITDRIHNISPILNKTISASTCKNQSIFKSINNNSTKTEAPSDRFSEWLNEESMDLPEILYMNGSFRTKQVFKSKMKEVQNKIKADGQIKSPYLAGFFSSSSSEHKK